MGWVKENTGNCPAESSRWSPCALIPRPKLLMLDESSLGLSPKFVNAVFDKITEINRDTGVTILIVEQKERVGKDCI